MIVHLLDLNELCLFFHTSKVYEQGGENVSLVVEPEEQGFELGADGKERCDRISLSLKEEVCTIAWLLRGCWKPQDSHFQSYGVVRKEAARRRGGLEVEGQPTSEFKAHSFSLTRDSRFRFREKRSLGDLGSYLWRCDVERAHGCRGRSWIREREGEKEGAPRSFDPSRRT